MSADDFTGTLQQDCHVQDRDVTESIFHLKENVENPCFTDDEYKELSTPSSKKTFRVSGPKADQEAIAACMLMKYLARQPAPFSQLGREWGGALIGGRGFIYRRSTDGNYFVSFGFRRRQGFMRPTPT